MFEDPAPETKITVAEIMTVCIARRMQDYRTVFLGFASQIPTVGVRLAREKNPELIHLSAAGGVNPNPDEMPLTTEDQKLVEGGTAHFKSSESFDLASRGKLDVMFVGSPQIDKNGSINGSVIGSWDNPKVRLGGAGGSGSLLPLIDNVHAWRSEHSERSLPDSVDFVSATGNLQYLVTPLCEFEYIDGELQVVAIHSHTSREEIEENTGWEVKFNNPTETELPTEEELIKMDEIDPRRVRRSEFFPEQLADLQ